MTSNAHNDDGYGSVKPSDVENGKPFSDELTREINTDGRTSETSSIHAQEGVKQVEAITTVWSKNTMVAMFIM